MNHSRRKDSRNLSSKPLFLISIILAVLLFTVYEILAMCGFVPPIGDPVLLIIICSGCGLIALILLYCLYSYHKKNQ